MIDHIREECCFDFITASFQFGKLSNWNLFIRCEFFLQCIDQNPFGNHKINFKKYMNLIIPKWLYVYVLEHKFSIHHNLSLTVILFESVCVIGKFLVKVEILPNSFSGDRASWKWSILHIHRDFGLCTVKKNSHLK